MNIPKLNLEAIRQSTSPEKENFEKEKTIYATTKNYSATNQTKNRISNRTFNTPHNLGRARELPQDWFERIFLRKEYYVITANQRLRNDNVISHNYVTFLN